MVQELNLHNLHGRRMRADAHVKQEIIRTGTQEGKARTASGLAAATGVGGATAAGKWQEEELAALQASARLTLAAPEIISIAADAGTVGKPSKDFLLMHLWAWPKRFSLVLPPQEHCKCVSLKLNPPGPLGHKAFLDQQGVLRSWGRGERVTRNIPNNEKARTDRSLAACHLITTKHASNLEFAPGASQTTMFA